MPKHTSSIPEKPSGFFSQKRQFMGSVLLLLFWLFVIFFAAGQSPRRERVPYSEFIESVEQGRVLSASVSSQQIIYTLRPVPDMTAVSEGEMAIEQITVPLKNDIELPSILRSHDVEVRAVADSGGGGFFGLLLPLVLLWFLWSSFTNRGTQGGLLNVGKSKARMYLEGSSHINFDDVAGVDEAKAELQEIVDFLQNAAKYVSLGAKIPKGVLLVGPPGTGKTLLARAIAGEAGVPFFSISASEFIEMFVGVGASRVRDLFEQAKQQAPCIVFIDELDALGKSRASNSHFAGNDEREQTLNQLLAEMDGFVPNAGVILLAATNRPEVLDPALLRAGRFDRRVVVDRPDKKGREAILAVHSRDVSLADDIALDKIAARTPGFAGADLANLINEAALLAARRNRSAVTMADFNEAAERILTGLERKSRVLNDLEKRTVAYHEAGHAIVGAIVPGAGLVEKISIVPRGTAALGYTLQLPEGDRFLMIENEIRGQLATLLGGRAAEELVFNRVSTGASDDIQKATDLAERCITLYGMSKVLGPIAIERSQSPFLEGYTQSRRAVSPHLSEAIDEEIMTLVEEAHQMAVEILMRNQDVLEQIAQTLLEEEVLEGSALKAFLDQIRPPSALAIWLNRGRQPLSAYSATAEGENFAGLDRKKNKLIEKQTSEIAEEAHRETAY